MSQTHAQPADLSSSGSSFAPNSTPTRHVDRSAAAAAASSGLNNKEGSNARRSLIDDLRAFRPPPQWAKINNPTLFSKARGMKRAHTLGFREAEKALGPKDINRGSQPEESSTPPSDALSQKSSDLEGSIFHTKRSKRARLSRAASLEPSAVTSAAKPRVKHAFDTPTVAEVKEGTEDTSDANIARVDEARDTENVADGKGSAHEEAAASAKKNAEHEGHVQHTPEVDADRGGETTRGATPEATSKSMHEDLLEGIDFDEGILSSPEHERREINRTGAKGTEIDGIEASKLDPDFGDDEDEFGDHSFLEELDDADLDADLLTMERVERKATPEIRVAHRPDGTVEQSAIHKTSGDPTEHAQPKGQPLPGLTTASGNHVAQAGSAAIAKVEAIMRSTEESKNPKSSSSQREEQDDDDPHISPTPKMPPSYMGFATASGRKIAPPSADALRKAQAKFDAIAKECESNGEQSLLEQKVPSRSSSSQKTSITAEKPFPVASSSQLPSAGFVTPLRRPMAPPKARPPAASFSTPAQSQRQQFAPTQPVTNGFSSPSKVVAPLPTQTQVTPSRIGVGSATSSSQSASASRALGNRMARPSNTSTPLGRRPKFKTPFKSSVDRVAALRGSPITATSESPASPSAQHAYRQTAGVSSGAELIPLGAKRCKPVFDVNTFRPRISMSDYGIQPESTSSEEATRNGCPIECLIILNEPKKAREFEFNGTGAAANRSVGPTDALAQLQKDGAKLVDIRWVYNHWALILWKLAAICRHQPLESMTRWTYGEVIRQLKYRYEREVNMAQRSAIKRIQEHDSAAGLPMTLCVYAIHRSEGEDEAQATQATIELTDGWYLIQATVDETLRLALARGRLKLGQKLNISGARLDCSGDGTDVLEAFGSSNLQLNSNGCSLALWDSKLGFRRKPFVSTLRALDPAGGTVPRMCIEIIKVFDVGFIDTNPTGQSAPRSQYGMATARSVGEEEQAAAIWAREREEWRMKLQQDWTSKLRQVHLVFQLLLAAQRVADSKSSAATSSGAEEDFDVEALLQQLESSSNPNNVLKSIPNLAPKLPVLLSAAQQRETSVQRDAHAELEAQLDEQVPPRSVRSFRVIKFVDCEDDAANALIFGSNNTNVKRKPCPREAQLTVWDATNLEGVDFVPGKKYMITNLFPTSVNSWRAPHEYAEVFLATRRDTTWMPVG